MMIIISFLMVNLGICAVMLIASYDKILRFHVSREVVWKSVRLNS